MSSRDDVAAHSKRSAPEAFGPDSARAGEEASSFDPGAQLVDGKSLLQRRLGQWGKVATLISFVYWPLWGVLTGLSTLVAFLPTIVIGSATFPAMWWLGAGHNRSITLLKRADVGSNALIGLFVASGLLSHPTPQANAVESLAGLMYLILLRAVLVPSTGERTLLVNLLFVTPPVAAVFFARGELTPMGIDPLRFFGAYALWCALGASVAVLASRALYGLGLQVHDARKLGQYTLQEALGSGGMGTVYRARHGMLRRPTAIKLLSTDATSQQQRFEREVQLTAEISHPNIVTIHDYGKTSTGAFYYAMELLEGLDLERLVSVHGPQTAGRVAHIVMQVTRGLARAHNAGLVHRDIKPGNLFLCSATGSADVVKILDFGLVKQLDSRAEVALTQATQLIGTPLYMAPESFADPDALGPAADQYGLGAVAYFLLVGEPVFPGRSLVELSMLHAHQPAPKLSERAASPVSMELEQVVARCLEKAPDRRFADVDALHAALQRCPEAGSWSTEAAESWWAARRAAAPAQSSIDVLNDTIEIDPLRLRLGARSRTR